MVHIGLIKAYTLYHSVWEPIWAYVYEQGADSHIPLILFLFSVSLTTSILHVLIY